MRKLIAVVLLGAVAASAQIPAAKPLTQERVLADAYIAVETAKLCAEDNEALRAYIGTLLGQITELQRKLKEKP